MPRKILHIDLDAFFCAVEETRNPELRGKAFAVGGRPEERGVVASCSYAARRDGVRSAMPMSRALRLSPGLIIIPSRHRHYSEVSRQVMAIVHDLTPLVEQISIDEAFLDISDLQDEPERLARGLQARIRDELHLPCSIGIASNKLVAKIATEVGKHLALKRIKARGLAEPPNAVTVVPFGEEAAFLGPLPADMLWGVGPKTFKRLADLGIHTIGDIAKWPENELIRLFGENGRDLARHAKGIDNRPIVTERETKSISQEVTFSVDVRDDRVLQKTVREQAARVASQLRRQELAGSTIKLKIRWPDFTTLTRQTTLHHRTDQEDEIAKAALELMDNVRKPNQAVRLIGVGVSGLGQPIRQLGLWDMDNEKSRRLQEALDVLREKYGSDVVHKGETK
ncbi:MAG: DNA polymerase IV [Anaerolineales bacterium]|nr:DNA polymerase IV [Anaerolineae bacterium]PWB68920.1 MAG: DNA polymerase IV [Anaerolineales bacterium]